MNLSPDQEQAVEDILVSDQPCSTLVGSAGTGKTFLLSVLAEQGTERWLDVEFIASTGRAASRVRQSVGREVKTVHSALYGRASEEKALNEGTQKVERTGRLTFGDPHAPCQPYSLLICDEASMVNEELDGDLFNNLPAGATLLYVGDREQLPPVEGKWGPDFENPIAVLDTVHRQAWESPIIRLATAIRKGEPYDFQPDPDLTYGHCKPEATAEWLVERRLAGVDAALLTWTNKIRMLVNLEVRRLLGYKEPVVNGDVLVCLTNRYNLGVMNGETLAVTDVMRVRFHAFEAFLVTAGDLQFLVSPHLFGQSVGSFKEFMDALKASYANTGVLRKDANTLAKLLHVNPPAFALKGWIEGLWLHVDYGFCLTVHKSQGSQWDEVGFLRCRTLGWKEDTEPDFARRLTYTAVTRAAKRLSIWDV